MIDSLDSRALRLTDCYAQRFMKAGTYQYNVLPVGGHHLTVERPFAVKVRERSAQTRLTQHLVVVTPQSSGFRVDRSELMIEAGDLVLWNCPDPKAMPYTVIGDKDFFDSQRLLNESGYSHAFGSAGEYHWKDAHGSSVAGIVRVKNPECKTEAEFRRWHESLTKGTLVMIAGERAEPREIDIVTGQTVFFAITKGPGISITDQRVLARQDGKLESRPARAASARSRK